VEKGGLMPDEVRAKFRVGGEMAGSKFFKKRVAIEIYTVPKFGSTMVEEVDTIEIEIFFMPTEHGFPRANVDVWRINT
jgi:hypothetical protein